MTSAPCLPGLSDVHRVAVRAKLLRHTESHGQRGESRLSAVVQVPLDCPGHPWCGEHDDGAEQETHETYRRT